MHRVFYFILFFSLPCFAAKPLKLTPLKPIKTTTLEITRMEVELISARDGISVATLGGKLGDCPECIRGVAIKGDFGFRLHGKTSTDLQPLFKYTSKVRMNTCPLVPLNLGQTYICEFVFENRPFKMIVKLAAKAP